MAQNALSAVPPGEENDLTIVAIGASAGGIEALSDLISHLPADTGMAFVLVQHLDPKHHSILTELLARKTSMKVSEVSDGLLVKPNEVYVIPPNAMMSISSHTLHLSPREESRGMHMSVDHFMRSLAEQAGNRAIGVILSGSGSDGTLGMSEIQAHGGVTFAQDEASAKYNGMRTERGHCGLRRPCASAQGNCQGDCADRPSPVPCAQSHAQRYRHFPNAQRWAERHFSDLAKGHWSGFYALQANHHFAAHTTTHGGTQVL